MTTLLVPDDDGRMTTRRVPQMTMRWKDWIIGALFTIAVGAIGFTMTTGASRGDRTEQIVAAHGERISALESEARFVRQLLQEIREKLDRELAWHHRERSR